jgi:hypothetical protein
MERPYPFQDRLKSKSLKTAYFEFNWKLYHELKKKADKIRFFMPMILMHFCQIISLPKTEYSVGFDSHEIFSEMPASGQNVTKIVAIS